MINTDNNKRQNSKKEKVNLKINLKIVNNLTVTFGPA